MRLPRVLTGGFPRRRVWISTPRARPSRPRMEPMPSTVLIVDDHPGFRASARRLLTSHGYTVVGEAANAGDALDAAQALEPELVLLDVGLPGSDGVEVARDLNARHPEALIVLVSTRDRTD